MCVFCKIVKGEIPADFVYNDDYVIAFTDIAPQAPTHIVVTTKEHIENASEVRDPELWGRIMGASAEIVKELGLVNKGYRFVVNTGEHGGQTVPHLHLHILAGRNLGWPPG